MYHISMYRLMRLETSVLVQFFQQQKVHVHRCIVTPISLVSTSLHSPIPHYQRRNISIRSSNRDAASHPTDQTITSAFGQVMSAQANFVRIKVDRLDGSEDPPPQDRLLCVVRALLKKIKQEVLVGDRMVEEVLPRTSQLLEPPVANITHVLLVFSLDLPPFQPSSATRYLIAASTAGIPVTVALNKADLLPPEQVTQEVERLASWGYDAIPISVKTGQGLDQLQQLLSGEVAVLAGPSGAGKSSIINALALQSVGIKGTLLEAMEAEPSMRANDSSSSEEEENVSNNGTTGGIKNSTLRNISEVDLQTVGSVSSRMGRGKHTTRNVTLIDVQGGGVLADTPGFNQPDLKLPPSELPLHFPEIQRILHQQSESSEPSSSSENNNTEEEDSIIMLQKQQQRCAFANCQHVSEPGCIVRGDWERYPYYVEILSELKEIDELEASRASKKKQREGNVRMKDRAGGKIGIEARLDTKRHRRVSRKMVKQTLVDVVREAENEEYEDSLDNDGGGDTREEEASR